MQIPGVERRSWAYIHPFLRSVEPPLVPPLAVVQFCRSASAAMKRDVQAAAVCWLVAEHVPMQAHLATVHVDAFLLIDFSQCEAHGVFSFNLKLAVEGQEWLGLA